MVPAFRDAVLEAEWQFEPFRHQLREFERNVGAKARALLWHMRTGKSKAIIDRAFLLRSRGLLDGVLVFAPNGVHANWIKKELPIHRWRNQPKPLTLLWRSSLTGKLAEGAEEQDSSRRFWKKVKAAKKSKDFTWLAMNSESMIRKDARNAIAHFIHNRRILIVFDESDDFGNPGSKRTKMARAVAKKCEYRNILSGTAVHTSPLAAWSQFELLAPGALGKETYAAFKDRYAKFVTKTKANGQSYPTLTGYKHLGKLRKLMAKWSSVVLREDCEDLPDVVVEQIDIEPTAKWIRAFRDLKATITTELRKDKEVSIGEKANKLQKLQQVFSGFVIDEFKETHRIPGPNPRLDALEREAVMLSGKAVVWCQFQEDIDLVCKRLRKLGFKVYEYHGRISNKRKAANLKAFEKQNDEKEFLVGHPKSGGRGLDMSAAGTIFFYSHVFSARARAQAIERATKMCGRNIRAVDFVAPGPDKHILRTVTNNINVANSLAGTGLRDLLKGMEL